MLDRLRHFWTYITAHPSDIGWAAFFALFFALILGLLDRQGRVRTGIRHLKNRWAEQSAARLGKRIKELQAQRDRYAAFLTSDKALYLATFRIVIGILVAIAVGAGFMVLTEMFPRSGLSLMAIFFYFLAVVLGVQGVKISSLDTPAKVIATVIKLNEEISDLNKKLGAMAK